MGASCNAWPGQVPREHQGEQRGADAPGFKHHRQRAVEKVLVDVIANHEQEREPLQGFGPAVGQGQAWHHSDLSDTATRRGTYAA